MAQKKPKFEELLAELDAIVKELEGGELSLDEMMERYEKGIKSLDLCRKILDEAEKKIEILVKGKDGELKTEPFEPEPNGDT